MYEAGNHLLVCAEYSDPELHKHNAAHIMISLDDKIDIMTRSERKKCHGIVIPSGVEHTANTDKNKVLIFLFDNTTTIAKQIKNLAILSDEAVNEVIKAYYCFENGDKSNSCYREFIECVYKCANLSIVENILSNGYYDNNRTGMPTYKLPHQIMQFNLEKEFPILTTKFVAFKTAVKEMLWIYKDQSNDVTKLQEQNVRIWDEWVDENNTIGRGYGYQIAKFNQIDKLIETLKTNPQDRRMLMTMWNIEDLPHMTLQPCCFMTMWDVTDGKLNCMLIQRSGDIPLGVPFNTSQYAVLVHLIAQVTGLKPGLFTHVINNAHIYENQIEGMKLQLTRANDEYEAPKLWINPEITDFYDFTADDIKLIDYKYHPAIKMEVSV